MAHKHYPYLVNIRVKSPDCQYTDTLRDLADLFHLNYESPPSPSLIIQDETPSPPYLDHKATLLMETAHLVSTTQQLKSSIPEQDIVYKMGKDRDGREKEKSCGTLALIGSDIDGNRVVKRIACGREWCTVCRQASHKRRIARVLPRMFQFDTMAYCVVTFPLEVRSLLKNKVVLANLARKARRVLKALGYTKIYTRWHFFGDESRRYNPHLNIIIDGARLTSAELDNLKTKLRRALISTRISKQIKKELVINYSYTVESKRKFHWIKYILRATFLEKSWDNELAVKLYGFHNGCFSGKFSGEKAWQLRGTDKKYNQLVKIAQGVHPESGKTITWAKRPLPWLLVQLENPIELGGWWYLLPPVRPPPEPAYG